MTPYHRRLWESLSERDQRDMLSAFCADRDVQRRISDSMLCYVDGNDAEARRQSLGEMIDFEWDRFRADAIEAYVMGDGVLDKVLLDIQ